MPGISIFLNIRCTTGSVMSLQVTILIIKYYFKNIFKCKYVLIAFFSSPKFSSPSSPSNLKFFLKKNNSPSSPNLENKIQQHPKRTKQNHQTNQIKPHKQWSPLFLGYGNEKSYLNNDTHYAVTKYMIHYKLS